MEELGGPENATIALQNISETDLSFEKIDEEGFVNFEEFGQLCRGEKLQKVGCARQLTAPLLIGNANQYSRKANIYVLASS